MGRRGAAVESVSSRLVQIVAERTFGLWFVVQDGDMFKTVFCSVLAGIGCTSTAAPISICDMFTQKLMDARSEGWI